MTSNCKNFDRGILAAVIIIVLINMLVPVAGAQDQNPPPKHLMREDSAAVNALVMYPDTIRLHIFQACEYPAAIVSIASLQKTSSDDFAKLIAGYSKDEQEDFWNIARYPSLITRLAEGGRKSEDEIKTILLDYPADVHDDALKYGRDYYDVIQKIDEMQSQTDAKFGEIISDYPPETQVALQDIIQYPEIISLLNEHLSLAVRVGDRFRRNPDRVVYHADSLHDAFAAQNAQDAQAWQQNIEQNPDEADELQHAAADYAGDNGYTQEDENAEPTADQVANYSCSPYSYWFGYPSWYPYSYWYPYPYWFDCGFYHDRYGKLVIIGSPSSYFTNWYFYSPDHWRRYPHLANAYITYYYGVRRSTVGNTVIVHNWVHENREYLPADFLKDPARRPDIIKQVGQLNVDSRKQKGERPVTPAVRDQYFEKNKARYPLLTRQPRTNVQPQDQQPSPAVVLQQPVKQPPVRIERIIQQPTPNPQQLPQVKVPEPTKRPPGNIREPNLPQVREPSPVQPEVKNQRQPQTPNVRVPEPVMPPVVNQRQPAVQQPPAPSYNFNNINKAQEYHRNVWQQTQPTPQPQTREAPRPAPAQPAPKQQPSRPTPGKR
ncbi:MAG TPA: hypothetical protein VLY03_04720 [Bacteroidota bacterium]|nr:hypothetical protein [Bacteroidota bacterium]